LREEKESMKNAKCKSQNAKFEREDKSRQAAFQILNCKFQKANLGRKVEEVKEVGRVEQN